MPPTTRLREQPQKVRTMILQRNIYVDHRSDIRETLITQAVGSSLYEVLEIAEQRQQSPSIWDSVTELPRILLEATSLAYSWPMLAAGPLGDGRPGDRRSHHGDRRA